MNLYHAAVEAKHAARAVVPDADILTRESLARARVFYWNESIFAAVCSASRSVPLKSTLRREDAPCDDGWFWFDISSPARALHWAYRQNPDGSGVFDLSTVEFRDNGPTWIGPDIVPESETFHTYQERFNGTSALADAAWFLQFVLAAFAWLRDSIIVPRREKLERHAAKRLARAGLEPEPVEILVLRKAERRDPVTHRRVEWQHWWIVRGHWVHQYYTKTGERRLRWRTAHAKGPRDKPFKPPSEQIYTVVR